MKHLTILAVLVVCSLVAASAAASPGDACQGISIDKIISVTPSNWASHATNLQSNHRYEFRPGTYSPGIAVDGLHDVQFVALGPVTLQGAAPGFPEQAVYMTNSSGIEFSVDEQRAPYCYHWNVQGPMDGIKLEDNSGCIGFHGLNASGHARHGLESDDDADLDLVVMGFRGCEAMVHSNGSVGLAVSGANLVTLVQIDVDWNLAGASVNNAHGFLQSAHFRFNQSFGLNAFQGGGSGQTDTDWTLQGVYSHGNGDTGVRLSELGSVDWHGGHASHNGNHGVEAISVVRSAGLENVELSNNRAEGLRVRGAMLYDLGLEEVEAHENAGHGLWIENVYDVSMSDVDADDSGGYGVNIENVDEANLFDLAVHDSGGFGIYVAEVGYTELTNSVITGVNSGVWVRGGGNGSLVFQDNFVNGRAGLWALELAQVGVENSTFDGSGLPAVSTGLHLDRCGRAHVRSNEVTRYQVAMMATGNGEALIEDNSIDQVGSIGISAGSNGEAHLARNHIYDVQSNTGRGISLYRNDSSIVVNNVISKVGWTPQNPTNCIAVNAAGIRATWDTGHAMKVVNNTVDHIAGAGYDYWALARASNTNLHNNLTTYACHVAESHNTWLTGQNDGYHQIWDTPFRLYVAANAVAANPLVLSPVPFEDVADAQLLSVSPMAGAGIWVPGVTPTTDYAGSYRGAGRISIGAFEPLASFTSPGSKKSKLQKR